MYHSSREFHYTIISQAWREKFRRQCCNSSNVDNYANRGTTIIGSSASTLVVSNGVPEGESIEGDAVKLDDAPPIKCRAFPARIRPLHASKAKIFGKCYVSFLVNDLFFWRVLCCCERI